MKILRIIPLTVLLAAGLPAQTPGTTPPAVDSLKNYLGLTDAQVTALQQLRRQQRESLRSTVQEMASKRRALRDAIETSKDAATIGQLQLDLRNLRQKVQDARKSLQGQAVNSLTPEQKAKLQALQEAAALQSTIRQAGALGLLTPPEGAGLAGPAGRRFGAMRRGRAPGAGRF